ncbi:hypothetical protein GW17_00025677 [Ensete ventricosum]|nr:hypothetical protein GW17_00025677 [Ensete ventricosum]
MVPSDHRITMRRDLPSRHRGSRCGGAVAFGRHLAGWRPPLHAAALATGLPLAALQQTAATYGLATGLPLAVAPWAASPCGLAAGDSPLRAGHSRLCPRGCCHYGLPPLVGGLAMAGRPLARGALVAADRPTRGLAVAMPDYPLQGLPSLRKRSKNA